MGIGDLDPIYKNNYSKKYTIIKSLCYYNYSSSPKPFIL